MNGSIAASEIQLSPVKQQYAWVILYWMPYDNDLVEFGEPIIEMLAHGTQSSDVAVVVQSDYWGDTTMRRRQILHGVIHPVDVVGEDSSDVAALSAYLDWAQQTFVAEHWVVIVVGHGGRTNEISPDDHGNVGQQRTWMRVDQFANAVSAFNQATNGRVELLFFQNCNKALLEVVYEVRTCARYTLASQRLLGAPNYYYNGFLNRLRDSSVDGRDAAIAIMASERPDMYHTLTLVDNQAVEQIPTQLSPLIEAVLSDRSSTNCLTSSRLSALSTYHYFSERQCDALVFLSYLAQTNRQTQAKFAEFANFLQSSIIAYYKTGGELYSSYPFSRRNWEGLSGLGLYLPETEQAICRYSSLALYQRVNLYGVFRKLLGRRCSA